MTDASQLDMLQHGAIRKEILQFSMKTAHTKKPACQKCAGGGGV